MYFDLPNSKERIVHTQNSDSCQVSTDTTVMTEERISEIIHNLDDHWGSPPILTPNTLSHILDHQWINQDVKQEDVKKVSKAAAAATVAATRVIDHNNKLISILVEEFCKTLQIIDVDNKHEITTNIKNDPIIQKFITNRQEKFTIGREENVIQHLIQLLSKYNKLSDMTLSNQKVAYM